MTQQLFTGMYGYGLEVVECCSGISRSENSARDPTFCTNNFRKPFVNKDVLCFNLLAPEFYI